MINPDDVPPMDDAPMNYYIVIGVRSGASADDIKSAYRRLSRELHPDVNPDPDAAKRFRDVKDAYDVLSNAAKRNKYDEHLAAAQQPVDPTPAGYPGPPPDADPPRFNVADEYPPPSAPYEVARNIYDDHALGEQMTHLWAHRGNWMVWRTTRWVEIDLAELRQAVYRVLDRKWFWQPTALAFKPCEWSPNKHKVADVLEALAAVTHLSARIDPPAWTAPLHSAMTTLATQMVSCRNGLFDLPNRALTDHTPDLFNLVSVPLDYDPDATEIAEWLKFMRSLWPDDGDSIALLQDWFGYVLSGRLEQQKMLLMIGPIRSGKGTIARTLEKLMGGKDNVAGPTLAQLGTNFGLASLLGKPLAIISDARLGDTPSHVVVERLLSITGEDTLDVDRKFREVCTGKLPTRLVMLSNELPKFRDSSGAVATRMLILRMTESFLNREDKKLDAKLTPELPGILNWALAGLDRLNTNGRFTVPKSSEDSATLMMDIASPMSAFIREKTTYDPKRAATAALYRPYQHKLAEKAADAGHRVLVLRDDLYAAYKMWAEDNGHHCGAKSTFGRDLRAVVPKLVDFRPRIGGKQIHTYAGIGLLPDSPDSPDDDAGQDEKSESGDPDSPPDSPRPAPSESGGESRHPDSPNGTNSQVSDCESGESGATPIVTLSKNSQPHTEAEPLSYGDRKATRANHV